MRFLAAIIVLALGATGAYADCGSCCGVGGSAPEPNCCVVGDPGPERTGNYAIHYLESQDTAQTYADPMFYYGSNALARWHRIRPRVTVRKRVVREERSEFSTRVN